MAIQNILLGTVASIAGAVSKFNEIGKKANERATKLIAQKKEQANNVKAFKTSVGTFEEGSKTYEKLVAMGEKPNATIKKGQ